MSGYSLGELVRAAGITERTVRYYVERRVLPGPELRGYRTTYTDEHLLRLRVIRRLRKVERLRLEAIARRLAGLSVAELRALLPDAPGPAGGRAGAAAAGDRAASAGRAAPAGGRAGLAEGEAAPGGDPATSAPAPPYAAERWERVVLIPGLELLVRADGGPLLQRLAREIVHHYGAAPGGVSRAPAG